MPSLFLRGGHERPIYCVKVMLVVRFIFFEKIEHKRMFGRDCAHQEILQQRFGPRGSVLVRCYAVFCQSMFEAMANGVTPYRSSH